MTSTRLSPLRSPSLRLNMTRETTTFDSQWVGDLSESPYCDQTLLRPQPTPCDPDYPYRSADGTCNNLKNPTWGAAFTQFRRAMPPDYGDGKRGPSCIPFAFRKGKGVIFKFYRWGFYYSDPT